MIWLNSLSISVSLWLITRSISLALISECGPCFLCSGSLNSSSTSHFLYLVLLHFPPLLLPTSCPVILTPLLHRRLLTLSLFVDGRCFLNSTWSFFILCLRCENVCSLTTTVCNALQIGRRRLCANLLRSFAHWSKMLRTVWILFFVF